MKILFDDSADTPISAWRTVDDVVMGGRSQSQVRWCKDSQGAGFYRFEGITSLENNGGFCSTRVDGSWDLSGESHLLWTLRGTKRPFLATLRDGATPQGASFRVSFLLEEEEKWNEISIALEDFRLFRRGQALSTEARVDPSSIYSFGFLLADRREGPFHLDIRFLKALQV